MYHLTNFSLSEFLTEHMSMLNDKGYILFDMVDVKYNEVPQNQFRTDCWKKQEKLPTEYNIRMAKNEVISVAEAYRLSLIEMFDIDEIVPKKSYVFKKY